MQYPYLTLLKIITLFSTLFVGTIIFYFLIKKWQETKFLTVLKSIALYELAGLIIYLIYPSSFLSGILHNNISKILDLFIFSILLYFVFHFVMKKFLSTSWKKSLVTFLLVIVIIFPFLDFLRVVLVQKISNLSVFAEESAKMKAELKAYFEQYPLGEFSFSPFIPPLPLSSTFKAIETIEKATLSWPNDYLREILLIGQMK